MIAALLSLVWSDSPFPIFRRKAVGDKVLARVCLNWGVDIGLDRIMALARWSVAQENDRPSWMFSSDTSSAEGSGSAGGVYTCALE